MLMVATAMFSLTGCDFFRNLAGRPTSEEIEAMRVEKLRIEEERLQADLLKLQQEKQAVEGKKRKELVKVTRTYPFEEIKYTKEYLDFK